MPYIATSVLSLLFLSTFGGAAPAPVVQTPPVAQTPPPMVSAEPHKLYPRQGAPIQALTAEMDSFGPSTHFAAAAYCASATTQTWTCGQHCNAIPGFKTSLVGGDGASTPRCEFLMTISRPVLPCICGENN
jgi:hypothetical protein